MCDYVPLWQGACMRACVCACMRACVRTYMYLTVCVCIFVVFMLSACRLTIGDIVCCLVGNAGVVFCVAAVCP